MNIYNYIRIQPFAYLSILKTEILLQKTKILLKIILFLKTLSGASLGFAQTMLTCFECFSFHFYFPSIFHAVIGPRLPCQLKYTYVELVTSAGE